MSRSPYDFNVGSQSFQLVLSPYDLVNGRNYLIRMRTLDSDREDHIAKYNGSYYEPSFTVLYTRDARKDENICIIKNIKLYPYIDICEKSIHGKGDNTAYTSLTT